MVMGTPDPESKEEEEKKSLFSYTSMLKASK
jgi:hypothetical protein